MGVQITQVDATKNQSTALFSLKRIFIFDNRFASGGGVYKNTTAGVQTLQAGMFVARAAGTYETASVAFSATPLAATETIIIAGLTYTSTAATTQAQLAAAFANLAVGATTGAGTATGTYSGTLAGYTTGPVTGGNTVVFESTTTGTKTDLVQTGTGAAAAITIVQGTAAIADGLIPVTSANLANIIGITAMDNSVDLAINQELFINFGVKGGIDATQLILPSGVALDTVVGSKTLKDILEAIGFHLETTTVENTKYDNN